MVNIFDAEEVWRVSTYPIFIFHKRGQVRTYPATPYCIFRKLFQIEKIVKICLLSYLQNNVSEKNTVFSKPTA